MFRGSGGGKPRGDILGIFAHSPERLLCLVPSISKVMEPRSKNAPGDFSATFCLFEPEDSCDSSRQAQLGNNLFEGVADGVFQAVFFRVVCLEDGHDPRGQRAPKCLKTLGFSQAFCSPSNIDTGEGC